ncbi:hypothetical protein MRB53_009242 [Persea americana]|uniref:Uncharacterized protein n=1 Tax=Persea americana TaxID=3435 RepID=A0ACC2LNL8_PERAE|nr:hypothetical protein MRB53_009242 [Persea americana]
MKPSFGTISIITYLKAKAKSDGSILPITIGGSHRRLDMRPTAFSNNIPKPQLTCDTFHFRQTCSLLLPPCKLKHVILFFSMDSSYDGFQSTCAFTRVADLSRDLGVPGTSSIGFMDLLEHEDFGLSILDLPPPSTTTNITHTSCWDSQLRFIKCGWE